ncbi:serine O-acetyltransferase [Formivibrio citricus]|uniref:Serine O-acetyltransferase n=1 Tax=Formivibrio citricus TaxID=83765 RepID=A0A1I4XVX9_9NEIS|nr:hypothetical protein [Formivibrio citricus]SFN30022.1 serine O-acetyltransferase [Formivibrio citricus]
MMDTSLPRDGIASYIQRLVSMHLPDGYEGSELLRIGLDKTLDRLEYCFSRIERKYYKQGGKLKFDHMNADHMAAFLYFLGNTIWQETGDTELPTRLSYLNKIMHGMDLFYSVRMPEIFMLVHPVGTVLGNADYGNYLVVYQNCTVGAVTNAYPRFGTGTILYSRSSVLGNCNIGDNVVFAANAMIVDTDIPADTLVLGQHPSCRCVPNKKTVSQRCFN